jgi:hypothetical protein
VGTDGGFEPGFDALDGLQVGFGKGEAFDVADAGGEKIGVTIQRVRETSSTRASA